tara:strand:+ start:1464 stop:2246 length:783 start_codon:yes stop_codon:yes gene_type:complete
VIPKAEEISDNVDYGMTSYFMSYYFPSNKLERFSHLETEQNQRFRSWLLLFKDLVKNNEIKKDYLDTVEFKLFKIMLKQFIKRRILKSSFNRVNKIGLINIPGHIKYTECNHNAISLIIRNLCYGNGLYVDMTNIIFRSETIQKGSRDSDINFKSLAWFRKGLNRIKEIRLDYIIVVDDVCTSGSSALAMFEKIQEHYFEMSENNAVKFFSFGKTLSEEEILKNNFSDPSKEIFLPEISRTGNYTKADKEKFKSSLLNIK